MPAYRAPDPESLIATHAETGARLYGVLGDVPLYVNARLLPGAPGQFGRRKSLHIGYVIAERRLARGWVLHELSTELREWVLHELADVYPSVEEAAGLNSSEVEKLKRKQADKRKEHEG